MQMTVELMRRIRMSRKSAFPSFFMSVRPYQLGPHWRDFRGTCYLGTPTKTLAKKKPPNFV